MIIEDYLNIGADVVFGKLHTYGSIIGVNVSDLADMGYEAEQGVTTLEKGTVIIGSWVVNNFYDPNARPSDLAPEPPELLGQQLRLVLTKYTSDGLMVTKTVLLRVVGILKESQAESDYSMYMSLDDTTAYNEWGQGKRINRNKDGYGMIIVKAMDTKSVIDITDAITNMGFQAYTPPIDRGEHQQLLYGLTGDLWRGGSHRPAGGSHRDCEHHDHGDPGANQGNRPDEGDWR